MKLLLVVFLSLISCSVAFSQASFPADYPADLPRPKITQAYPSSKLDNGLIFQFESELSVADVLKFFQDEMPKLGYKISNGPTTTGDVSANAGWNKGSREVTVMIVNSGTRKTSISILYQ